jgi:hypothetical protein
LSGVHDRRFPSPRFATTILPRPYPATLERFRAKWISVRVKKTRQNKNPEHDPEKGTRVSRLIKSGLSRHRP